jgi:acetamidase/formamidase
MMHARIFVWSAVGSEGYMLCSVLGDLKIAEIVDAPNWVVSFHFPTSPLAG